MSKANVEVVRAGYEAWNRGDFEYFAERMSLRWEFHVHNPVVGLDEVYRGPDGWRKFVQDWTGVWETIEIDVDRILDADDEHVLGLLHLRGRARDGMAVAIEYAHLFTIRQGLHARLDGYGSWRDGIEAAGLDRSELEE